MRLKLLGVAALAVTLLLVLLPWWRREHAEGPESAVAVITVSAGSDDGAGADVRTALPALPTPPSHAPQALEPARAVAGSPPARLLKVRVSNSAGTRVAGARVSLWAAGASHAAGGSSLSHATTDESGLCAVLFTAPDQEIVAEHESYGSSGYWTIDEARARLDERDEVPLKLRYLDTIRGSVRYADGRPAEEASIHARLVETKDAGGGRPRASRFARVMGGGLFELALERGGTYELLAVGPEGEMTTPVRVSLPDDAARFVELVFTEAPTAIRGTVERPDGQPVVGASVRWSFSGPVVAPNAAPDEGKPMAREPRVSQGVGMVFSRAGGAFAIAIERPGQYTLIGSAEGFASSPPVTVTLTEDRSGLPDVVKLRLAPFATIAGTLMWDNGAPIIDMTVKARPAGRQYEAVDASESEVNMLFGVAEAITDWQGRFELAGLNGLGNYRVSCELDALEQSEESWRARRRIVIAPDVPGGTQDLLLIASEAMFEGIDFGGLVVDALTQQPVDRVHVVVTSRCMDNYVWLQEHVLQGPDGRFLVRGALPGERYSLEVHGWLGELELATRKTDWFTARDPMDDMFIELLRTGDLEVFVRDPAGAPIRGARVTADWIEGESHWAPLASNEAGRALFKPVNPGHYRITAELEKRLVERVVEVASGERLSVTLTWPPEH